MAEGGNRTPEGVDLVKENGYIVVDAMACLGSGTRSMRMFPRLVRQIIESEAWRRFEDSEGRLQVHDSFAEFVSCDVPRGLGSSPEQVRKLVEGDAELIVLVREALKGKPGRPSKESEEESVGNTNPLPEPKNSKAYTLDRLKREKPELFQQVSEGQLSANAAAVMAGWRPKTFTVQVKSPQHVASAIRKHLTEDQVVELGKLLLEDQ